MSRPSNNTSISDVPFKIYSDITRTLSKEKTQLAPPIQLTPSITRAGQKRARSLSRPRQSPDRFIPSSSSAQSFRINNQGSQLPGDERNKRLHSPTPDPLRRAIYSSPMTPPGTANSFGTVVSGNGSRRIRNYGRPRRTVSLGSPMIEAKMNADEESHEEEMERHEGRLALALGMDRGAKVFSFSLPSPQEQPKPKEAILGAGAKGDPVWGIDYGVLSPAEASPLLDAPGLRDDYYCTLLAYSPICQSLAVGLHSEVYLWNEGSGASPYPPWSQAHVTTLAFSSAAGGHDILAIGRINGLVSLWAVGEECPRAEAKHSCGVAYVAWKPCLSRRYNLPGASRESVRCEELLVGDEMGNVFYYAVEWATSMPGEPHPLEATMVLIKRLNAHTQQICGITWSPDGEQVATGGNDNMCVLYDVNSGMPYDEDESENEMVVRHKWPHSAAVKAIAFCPWQKSLVATGGGSNDRCIHFFHTYSGAALATLHVSAQITSLVWSKTHKEIAATFGYANPEHPIRIAVFSWPECRKIVSIPWVGDMRALFAIQYPGGPPDTRSTSHHHQEDDDTGRARSQPRAKRSHPDGCLVVAASDETIRFHEIWGQPRKGLTNPKRGVLGGSDILESLEGIDNDDMELIR